MALEHIEQLGLRISRLGVWCGGLMMVASSFIIGAEVVLRKVFLVSLGGADEMASYALALGTVWALSFALMHRSHIRVDALYQHLPKQICALLDVLALVSVLAFSSMLAWYGFDVWLTSWEFDATANTPLGTPLWIPQGLWVLGLFSFVLTTLLLLARALGALLRKDIDTVRRLAGTRTVDEELRGEREAVERAAAGTVRVEDRGGEQKC